MEDVIGSKSEAQVIVEVHLGQTGMFLFEFIPKGASLLKMCSRTKPVNKLSSYSICKKIKMFEC